MTHQEFIQNAIAALEARVEADPKDDSAATQLVAQKAELARITTPVVPEEHSQENK